MNRPEWTIPLRPMSAGEVAALARYNADGWEHPEKTRYYYAVQQWRWNVEKREAMLDQGAYAMPGGGYLWIGDRPDGVDPIPQQDIAAVMRRFLVDP